MNFLDFLKKIDVIDILSTMLDEFESINSKEIYLKFLDENVDFENLKEELNDIDGLKILYVYLIKAYEDFEIYNKLGIDKKIYFDTFKCFRRFIDETYEMTGKVIFDRYFWTYRQTELKLFRIGELEFEICDIEKVISIHIPSDAKLTEEEVKKSLNEAKKFFLEIINKSDYIFKCTSWLLSPNLKEVLNEQSNILRFQELFSIESVNLLDDSGISWIFKTDSKEIKTFKEETSLQKKLKKRLLNGEHIGIATGVLK